MRGALLVAFLFVCLFSTTTKADKQCGAQTAPSATSCGALYNAQNCPDFCCQGVDPADTENNPWEDPSMACFMPAVPPFVVESVSTSGKEWSLVPSDTQTDLFGGAAGELSLEIDSVNENLLVVKITAPQQNSYSVPESVIPRPPVSAVSLNDTNFEVTLPNNGADFQLKINAKDVTDNITDTRTIMLMNDLFWSSDGQYLQFVLAVDSLPDNEAKVFSFGIGENSHFTHQMEPGQRRTLWANDLPCSTVNESLYGSHPVLYQVIGGGSHSGKAHGLVLVNSNAMDVSLSSDNNLMTFQISGGEIEIYLAAGPTPNEVSGQLQSILAYNEDGGAPGGMPPYWSYGFHNCKYGYTNIGEVEDVYDGYVEAMIPYDTQWMDIDYMDQWRDFTYDSVNFPAENVSALVNKMKKEGRQYVPIIDPGILVPNTAAGQDPVYSSLQDGLDQNIFVKNGDFVDVTSDDAYAPYYVSQVWPGATLSPDWFNPNTTGYWENQLANFRDLAEYRGLWIDMNEFANFCADETTPNSPAQKCTIPDTNCPNSAQQTTCCLVCEVVNNTNTYDFPPFVPHGYYQVENQNGLGSRTIVASAQHHGYVEYDVHNLFGLMEAIATNSALQNIVQERPFILSRSTFLTSGKHTAHWTGDNYADWENLRISIVTVNTFGLFNIPMVGADMCGFMGSTTEDLCNRWVAVAAFHPFSRDHNSLGEAPQELYIWPSVTECARRNLGAKYMLLPWLNWLFYDNLAMGGAPPVQALWQSFPQEMGSFSADQQFTWGGKVLFSPAVFEGQTEVQAFFPQGMWYDYFSYCGDPYDANPTPRPAGIISTSETVTLTTPMNHTNVHIYEGSAFLRHNAVYDFDTGTPYTTTQLLEMDSYSIVVVLDADGTASGSFVLDDGKQMDINNSCVNSITVADQVVTIAPVIEDFGAEFGLRCLEVLAPAYLLVNDTSQTEVTGCFSSHGWSTTTNGDLATQVHIGDGGFGLLTMCFWVDHKVALDQKMFFSWGGSTDVCANLEQNEEWWHSLKVWQQGLFITIAALIAIVCISIIVIFICFVVPKKRDPDAYIDIQ